MAELLQLLSHRVVAHQGVVAAALHADPGSKVYELMAKAMADRLKQGHVHPHCEPIVQQANERDHIPQHFVNKLTGLRLNYFAWGLKLYHDREECMYYTLDGGPRNHWLNVFTPFDGCHGPPPLISMEWDLGDIKLALGEGQIVTGIEDNMPRVDRTFFSGVVQKLSAVVRRRLVLRPA